MVEEAGFGVGTHRALDNINIERFSCTLKYEDIYINDYRTLIELKQESSDTWLSTTGSDSMHYMII